MSALGVSRSQGEGLNITVCMCVYIYVFLSLLILLFALNCLYCMHKFLFQSVLILDKYMYYVQKMCMLFLSLNKLLNNSCCTSAKHSNTH